MMMITNLIGKPEAALIDQIEDADNRTFMRQLPNNRGKDFNELFRGANDQAIDLIKRMLTFDPERRITIDQALAHPYMEKLHFEDDEPTGEPMCDFDFDFELFSLKIPEYKELIFEEIKLYHDDEAKTEYESLKKTHTQGHLHTKYPKERLRTMYKQDPGILSTYYGKTATGAASSTSSSTAAASSAAATTPAATTAAASK